MTAETGLSDVLAATPIDSGAVQWLEFAGVDPDELAEAQEEQRELILGRLALVSDILEADRTPTAQELLDWQFGRDTPPDAYEGIGRLKDGRLHPTQKLLRDSEAIRSLMRAVGPLNAMRDGNGNTAVSDLDLMIGLLEGDYENMHSKVEQRPGLRLVEGELRKSRTLIDLLTWPDFEGADRAITRAMDAAALFGTIKTDQELTALEQVNARCDEKDMLMRALLIDRVTSGWESDRSERLRQNMVEINHDYMQAIRMDWWRDQELPQEDRMHPGRYFEAAADGLETAEILRLNVQVVARRGAEREDHVDKGIPMLHKQIVKRDGRVIRLPLKQTIDLAIEDIEIGKVSAIQAKSGPKRYGYRDRDIYPTPPVRLVYLTDYELMPHLGRRARVGDLKFLWPKPHLDTVA